MPCKARLTGRRDRYGEVPFDRSTSSHYHRSKGDDDNFAIRKGKATYVEDVLVVRLLELAEERFSSADSSCARTGSRRVGMSSQERRGSLKEFLTIPQLAHCSFGIGHADCAVASEVPAVLHRALPFSTIRKHTTIGHEDLLVFGDIFRGSNDHQIVYERASGVGLTSVVDAQSCDPDTCA